MNAKMAAQAIRDEVGMDQILNLYGYRPKHGFMCCPFHGEKEPSLKIYPRTGGWHCFGCGKGGSVIDFVMEHENCTFRTAVCAIDKALGLGLMDPGEDAFSESEEKRVQIWLDSFVKAVDAYLDQLEENIEREQKTRLDMVRLLEEKRDADPRQLTAGEWTEIARWKEDDEYDEYRKDMVSEFREEVAAWRRAHRRAKSAS